MLLAPMPVTMRYSRGNDRLDRRRQRKRTIHRINYHVVRMVLKLVAVRDPLFAYL